MNGCLDLRAVRRPPFDRIWVEFIDRVEVLGARGFEHARTLRLAETWPIMAIAEAARRAANTP